MDSRQLRLTKSAGDSNYKFITTISYDDRVYRTIPTMLNELKSGHRPSTTSHRPNRIIIYSTSTESITRIQQFMAVSLWNKRRILTHIRNVIIKLVDEADFSERYLK